MSDLSLDDFESKKLITFKLRDGEMSIDAKYFEKNTVLSHLSYDEQNEQKFILKVDLLLCDFIPIYQYICGKIIPRGTISDYSSFFDFCQYIGEIDLPILVSKDSHFITKWYMTKDDLIKMEKERLLLEMYVELDKDEKEEKYENIKEKILEKYMLDKFNMKLNEKSGFELFREIKKISIGSHIFPLEEINERIEKSPYAYKNSSPSFSIKKDFKDKNYHNLIKEIKRLIAQP